MGVIVAPRMFRLIPHMVLGVLLTAFFLWPPASTVAQEAQAEKVVFSDDFESGDTWDWWTNGTNGNKSITTANVRSGKKALMGRASASPSQPEVGLAFIKNCRFTEQESAFDFWFYAGGTAKYKAVVVEAFSKEHSGFFWCPVPMGEVPVGKWTQVSILFSEISRQLRGDEIYRFVIKPTIVPDSGDAEFIIDDVKVVSGVKKPLCVEWVEPGDLAVDVSTRPVFEVFVSRPLDASTVNTSAVCVQDSTGHDVPALLYYSLGQHAILISPHRELAPRSKYTVVAKGGPKGIVDESGARLETDYTWSFITGERKPTPRRPAALAEAAGATGEVGGAGKEAESLDARVLEDIAWMARHIMEFQNQDGAIVLGAGGNRGRIIPYFSNFAVLGLLRAYELTHIPDFLTSARRWLEWYVNHMNADGTVYDYTGLYPDHKPTGDYDSTDSYAATFILAVWRYYRVTGSRDFLTQMYPYVVKALGAIDLTYGRDGLTFAKPGWPVKYLMDNAEVWLGLAAGWSISATLGDIAYENLFAFLADKTMDGLRNQFWLSDEGYYAMSIQSDGTKYTRMDTWYPDALSNILFLAVTGSTDNSLDRDIFDMLYDRFYVKQRKPMPSGVTDNTQYLWWAMAACQVGRDQAATGLIEEFAGREGMRNTETLPVSAGHLIRVLSFTLDRSLWF